MLRIRHHHLRMHLHKTKVNPQSLLHREKTREPEVPAHGSWCPVGEQKLRRHTKGHPSQKPKATTSPSECVLAHSAETLMSRLKSPVPETLTGTCSNFQTEPVTEETHGAGVRDDRHFVPFHGCRWPGKLLARVPSDGGKSTGSRRSVTRPGEAADPPGTSAGWVEVPTRGPRCQRPRQGSQPRRANVHCADFAATWDTRTSL